MEGDARNKERTVTLAAYGILLAAIFVLAVSVKVETSDEEIKIWFEAESAYNIGYPMEISDDVDSSGERCIEIKEGMGAKIYGRGEGQAVYEIQIPKSGLYALWARAYWLDGCSNSFTIKIGDGNYTVGEDAHFKEWHWVSKPVRITGEGGETLIVRNREDGIKIDRFLLTQDLDFVPQDVSGGLKFFDFDDGSTAAWLPGNRSRWNIREEEGMHGSPAYYLNRSRVTVSEYSLVNVRAGGDFVFQCLARCLYDGPGKRNIRLIVDHRDNDNYSFIDFENEKISYGKVVRSVESIAGTSGKSIGPGLKLDRRYHFLEVTRKDGKVFVKYDGIPACAYTEDGYGGGSVGVGSLYGDVYFDNIVLSNSRDFNYSQTFYYDDTKPVEVAQGWIPEAGNWFKTMLHGTQSYEVLTGDVAATLAGSRLWNNYSYEVAQKADGESGIGIIFYCQDNRNTYLFRWAGENSTKDYANKKQLVRVLDGNVRILAEEKGGYPADQWYRMKAEVLDGRIKTFIDDRLIFDVYDESFFQGRIGLWLDGHSDDLDVFPRVAFWPGNYSYESWSQVFPVQCERENIKQGIYFCYQDSGNHYLLRWGGGGSRADRNKFQLVQVLNGEETLLEQTDNFMMYSYVYTIMISRVQDGVQLKIGQPKYDEKGDPVTEERARFDIGEPVFTSGRIGFDAGRGVNGIFDDIRVESMRDFYDDFRSGDAGTLYWTRLGGSWSAGDGAFTAPAGSPSRAVAGEAGWEDYTYEVKARRLGGGAGAFGIYFYHLDGSNHYLYRCVVEDGVERGELVRVSGGKEEVLGGCGLVPAGAGWVDLRVELDGGWIGIYSGGDFVLGAYDWGIRGGRVGLYTDGVCGVSFDDVRVGFEKPYHDLERVSSIFVAGEGEDAWREHYEGWVTRGGEWVVENGELVARDAGDGAFIWQDEGDYLDDVTVELDVRAAGVEGEGVRICLGGRGKDMGGGYGFSFGGGGVRLYRGPSVVASGAAAGMEAGRGYRLRFERRRGHLLGYIDGKCVVMYGDAEPLAGGDVGIMAGCGGTAFDNVEIHTYPLRYYAFNLNGWAATDFSHWRVVSGNWSEVSSVIYSLYGEKDADRDAVIWHKEPLPEDAAVSLWYSPLFFSEEGEFTISICGDGENTDSGYMFHFRYDISEVSDNYHSGYMKTALLKGGRILAEKEITLSQYGHGVRMRIEKRGDRINLYLGEKPVMAYRDSGIPSGRMFALGVKGEREKPVFFGGIEIHALR